MPTLQDSTAFGEIVVTGGKRPAVLSRAPYAISALTAAQLEVTQAEDIPALAAQIAGLTVTNLGAGRDKLLLRGLSDGVFTGSTQSTVALYLDDIPITYSAPDPDFRLVDVDRVEVLRGPQGTLYGSGSMSGVFRIVTRQPDPSGWYASVKAGAAFTRSGAPSHYLQGAVNIPVVDSRLAVRLVGYQESEGGYIKDLGLNLTHINRVSRTGLRIAARLDFTRQWSLTAGVVSQAIASDDTQYTNAPRRLRRTNLVREPHDNDFDEAYATLQGAGEWGALKWSTALLRHDFNSRYDASGAVSQFIKSSTSPAVFNEDRRIDLLVSELTFSSPEQGRFHWIAGAFAATGAEEQRWMLTPLNTGTLLYHEARTDHLGEFAVYGEASYNLTGKIAVTAGLRVFRSTLKARSTVTQPALGPAVRTLADEATTSGLAPKFVLSYRPDRDVTFYAQATRGYRAAGFNTAGPLQQAFAPPQAAAEPKHRFTPDELWNFELGAKLALLDGAASVRTAVYYALWDNIQTDQFLRSGLPFTVNVGDGTIAGAEAEVAWRLSDRLSIRSAALLDDPQLTREQNRAFVSRNHAGLPGVATVSASAALDYRQPLADRLALRAGAQYAYVGPSHVTFDAHAAARMGGYGVVKLTLGLETPHWKLTAFIDNLLDTAGNTFAFGNPFSFLQNQQFTPVRPRTVGAAVGYTF